MLWVVPSVPALHTGRMPGHATTTAFVTEADGFIGTELIKVLAACGHHVVGLAPSMEAAERVQTPCSRTSDCAGWVHVPVPHARAGVA